MNNPDTGATKKAEGELGRLQSQVEAMRAVLVRLLQEVVVAEARLDNSQAGQLLEANEQLVLAAIGHQADAETATLALDEVSRSYELDALTQLPNRTLFLDRLTQAIADAKRHGTSLAVLFVDLNKFKDINDALGHAVGDQVLKRVALCLLSSVREADTVGRQGGDEFLILLTQVRRAADALRVADKAIAALGAPTRIGGHVLRLSASIGISHYPDDGQTAAALIDRADAAMYQAKRQGPGSFVFDEGHAAADDLANPLLRSLQHPVARYDLALADYELRYSQLREANEQLVLSALNAQELQAAAEQAVQRQAEFLAVVAQELRNPLAPIRVATLMLGRVKTDEPLLPRAQAIIGRQIEQMTRLVNDLVDVSRVKSGQLSVELQQVDVADIIDDAISACRPAMDTRLQSLDVKVPSRALKVKGDPVRLVQVLHNLLNNASKYTPDRGEIGLHVTVDEGTLLLAVFDNGIGITAEALPSIFEAFVQDTHAIGYNGVGLGVGLTVVRRLVEAHGGQVVASSEGRGLGSRFVVSLPLLQASDAEPPRPAH